MMKVFFTLSLWVFTLGLSGNPDKIDSLLEASQKADENQKAIIFNKLAKLYWYNNFDSSLKYGNAAYDWSIRQGNAVEEARALNNLGVAYELRGEYGRSLNHYFQVFKMAIAMDLFKPELPFAYFLQYGKDTPQSIKNFDNQPQPPMKLRAVTADEVKELQAILANCYMNAGIVFGRLSHFEKSLACFSQSSALRQQLNDLRGIAMLTHNMGMVYLRLQNYPLAEKSFRESLAYRRELNDSPGQATTKYALGELFIMTGKTDSAFFYLKKASSSFAKLNHRKGEADTHAKLGELFRLQSKPQAALRELQYALEIRLYLSDREGVGALYLKMGEIHMGLHELGSAQQFFGMALDIARAIDNRAQTAESLLGLSKVAEMKGQIAQSFSLYKEHITVLDGIKEEKYSTALAERLTLYEVDKMSSENALLKKEHEIRELNYARQSMLQMLLVALCLMLLFTGFALLYMYRALIKANRKLSAENSNLELQHSNRTLELKDALKLSEEALQTKSSVLSSISHEIRTPLNGIVGFASLLRQEFDLSSDQGRYVKEISSSTDKLMGMLNDLIDISRAESNRLRARYSLCSLPKKLNDVLNNFSNAINSKGIKLITNIEKVPPLLTDSENIDRILTIVIGNAVKYTEKGSISATLLNKGEDGSVEIIIADTGIGIDPEYLPFIFEPFQQESRGLSRLYQGTGLGLALAKRLVTLLGGTIHVTSRKGAGTIANVKFPAPSVDQEPMPIPAKITPRSMVRGREPRAKKAKVLIIEENTYTRFYLQSLLHKYFNIYVARNGSEALSILDDSINYSSLFDLVVVEGTMPEPWGAEAFISEAHSRKNEYSKRAFVVQLEPTREAREQLFMEMGYFQVIRKPITKKLLLETLLAYSKRKNLF